MPSERTSELEVRNSKQESDEPVQPQYEENGQDWKLNFSTFAAARKENDLDLTTPWKSFEAISSNCYGVPRLFSGEKNSGNKFREENADPEEGNLEETDRLVQNVDSRLSDFYQNQNETIDGFSEMDKIRDHFLENDEEKMAQEELERSEQFAINISNFANVCLLGAKIVVSVESMSLSVITSTLDSLLDCLSGFILWFTAISMKRASRYKYPIGSQRMQPLGIIVFASVMATLGFQILLEAIRQLASGTGSSQNPNDWLWLIGIMGGATVVKLCLFLYCNLFSNEIVKAYALDHFFDVVTNTVGLFAALMGEKLVWWIDPVGAIVLAIYTMRLWSLTVMENVASLTGESAPPSFLQKLTYLCWNHHPKIKCIDTVRAYTFGTHYFCEVDIVLPAEMPLQEAHDIGESLQNKLELVPEIERAFVHLDYEFSHHPEHSASFKKLDS